MLQFEYHALARRQPGERYSNFSSEFAAHQIAFGIGARACVRHLFEKVVLLARRIGCDRSVLLANTLLAQMVEAEVSNDPVDPGVEGTLEAETAQILVGLQKGLLIDILGVGFRSCEVKSQAQDGLIVVPHKHLESSAIATLSFADQTGVVDAVSLCCHGSPRREGVGTAVPPAATTRIGDPTSLRRSNTGCASRAGKIANRNCRCTRIGRHR